MKSKLIVFEGGEGVGKGTQISLIQSLLEEQGYKVVCTREPGGTLVSEKIRSLIVDSQEERVTDVAKMCLAFAARELNTQRIILPALEKGCIVLCDRYDASTYAYQLDEQDAKSFKRMLPLFQELRNQIVLAHVLPSYVWMDAKPEIGLNRIAVAKGRETNEFEEAGLEFHRKVRRQYKEYFESISQTPFWFVDASDKNVNKVFNNVLKGVLKFIETS